MVWPESAEDVAAVLERTIVAGVPVTSYGAGTGIAGNAVPTEGGVSLDTMKRDTILGVQPDDFQVDPARRRCARILSTESFGIPLALLGIQGSFVFDTNGYREFQVALGKQVVAVVQLRNAHVLSSTKALLEYLICL